MANSEFRRFRETILKLTTDKIVFPEVWPTDEDVAESRPDRMRDERVILFTSLHHNRLENKRKNLLSSDWLTDSPTILYYLIRTRRRKRVRKDVGCLQQFSLNSRPRYFSFLSCCWNFIQSWSLSDIILPVFIPTLSQPDSSNMSCG